MIGACVEDDPRAGWPEERFRIDKQGNVKGSDYDDNIPAWIRVSDEYARGFHVCEQQEEYCQSQIDMHTFYRQNPGEQGMYAKEDKELRKVG